MADVSLAHIARQSGIYEIVCEPTGKRYIGSSIDFDKRWKAHRFHLDRGTHHSRHMQNAWCKYGANAFRFSCIVVCAPRDLLMFEQRALDALRPAFNTAPHAYSALGMKHTPETKAKQSAAMMGNQRTLGYKHRPESIEKLRAKQLGVPSPTKGKKRDPAAVAATAAAHRGMKRSKETCEKIAAKAKGRVFPPRSAEYRAKISARTKGRKLSLEHLAAFIAGRRAQVITEDMRQAMSERVRHQYETGARSRVRSTEYRAKIAATLTGRKATPEARANQAAAQLGKKRGPYKKRILVEQAVLIF